MAKKDRTQRIKVKIAGRKPIMFNRFPGTIDTKICKQFEDNPEKKFYRLEDETIYFPLDGVFSFFCAQKGKSCVNRWGPQGPKNKQLRLELAENFLAYVEIGPEEIIFIDDKGKPIKYEGWSDRMFTKSLVGRVEKNGQLIPQPTIRPLLTLPWGMEFNMAISPNPSNINVKMVEGWLQVGGQSIGFGSYRPRYGTFDLVGFKVE